MNIRGLFQSIFGKRPTDGGGSNLPAFRLLSTWDSSFTPFSGNAWDIATVRAAVDAWARNAAKIQPRHIRRADGRREDVGDSLNRILQSKPNPYMTAYAFYYRVAAQFIVYNNAFILPVFDGGRLTALYPINASRVELVEYMGDMYARLTFSTGSVYTCPYEQLIHLRRHYLNNDIFGDDNQPLTPTLETAESFNKSMSKFAQLVAVIRGNRGRHPRRKCGQYCNGRHHRTKRRNECKPGLFGGGGRYGPRRRNRHIYFHHGIGGRGDESLYRVPPTV